MRPRLIRTVLDFLDFRRIVSTLVVMAVVAVSVAAWKPIAAFLMWEGLPVWVALLFAGVVGVVVWWVRKVNRRVPTGVLGFGQGDFYDMRWRWTWGGDDGTTVMNLTSYCPEDSTPLDLQVCHGKATCPTCSRVFCHNLAPHTLVKYVEARIEGKRQRKEPL